MKHQGKIYALFFTFPFLFTSACDMEAVEKENSAIDAPLQNFSLPIRQGNILPACNWEHNNAPTYCLYMGPKQQDGRYYLMVSAAKKGLDLSPVADFTLEIRKQEGGDDDYLQPVHAVVDGFDRIGFNADDLPCGFLLVRAKVGNNYTGGVPFENCLF